MEVNSNPNQIRVQYNAANVMWRYKFKSNCKFKYVNQMRVECNVSGGGDDGEDTKINN